MITKTPNNNLDKKLSCTRRNKGFTLVELMTVIVIFGILTTIFVSNYSSFTDDATLTNMAYELALSVREAQVYGVAVTNQTTANFNDKYGISFTNGISSYFLFVDLDSESEENMYDGTNACTNQECKKEYVLQRQTAISNIKVKEDTNCSQKVKLDIIFERPNPEPIINADLNITMAQIELKSRSGKTEYVIISNNGQIYVTNEPEC